jgi:hypothetical protein
MITEIAPPVTINIGLAIYIYGAINALTVANNALDISNAKHAFRDFFSLSKNNAAVPHKRVTAPSVPIKRVFNVSKATIWKKANAISVLMDARVAKTKKDA